jgi:hypothetical protein
VIPIAPSIRLLSSGKLSPAPLSLAQCEWVAALTAKVLISQPRRGVLWMFRNAIVAI